MLINVSLINTRIRGGGEEGQYAFHLRDYVIVQIDKLDWPWNFQGACH